MAVFARPARSYRLFPRPFSWRLRRAGNDPRAALERAIHAPAPAIHRRIDSPERERVTEGRRMSPAKMRIGLIGAGAIAQTHAQALAQSATAELVGVCDVRKGAAEALAERERCPAFGAYQDLVEATGCEAAIVCTPPVSHSEICHWLLSRGI